MTIEGWRARIGYMKPTYHGNDLAFWVRTAPTGVSFTPAIIGYVGTSGDEFLGGLDRAASLARDLAAEHCSVAVVVGTPPFLMIGPEKEAEWIARLEQEVQIPIVTAMRPHALALRALGARRILSVTYYGDELNEAIAGYFREFDIDTVATHAFTVPTARERDPSELQTSSHDELGTIDFGTVYEHVKQGYQSLDEPVDAIYINGTGWNVEPSIEYLEQDLGLPVICAVHCVSWYAYRRLLINNSKNVSSTLYRTWPELPET